MKRHIIPAHPSELTECWMDGCGLSYSPPLRVKLYRWWKHRQGYERVVDIDSIANWADPWYRRDYKGDGYVWIKEIK